MAWTKTGALATGGGFILRQQVFTASGTFTPSAKMIAQGGNCSVLVVGGGGGGAYHSGGGAGGSGGCVIARTLTGVTSAQTVTIGAGGTGGTSGTPTGGTGGTTSFGSLLSAAGGVSSGTQNQSRSAGEGSGYGGGIYGSYSPGIGLHGFGAGAPGGQNAPMSGLHGSGSTSASGSAPSAAPYMHAAANSGGGGAGGIAATAGNGGSGICIVEWWEAP